MKKINLEKILAKIFEPTSQDCSTTKQDLQLAITLNPDLNRILESMKQACSQCLDLAAENIKTQALEDFGSECQDCWTEDSILQIKDWIK